MKNLNAYLSFAGNCEEALNFYRDSIGGEVASMMRYADSPMEVPQESAQWVMHAEFRSGDLCFMAADGMPGQEMASGGNVSLMMNLTDGDEQEQVFNALADGGTVTMPLQDTFWGARFGMVTDRYGINWMLHWNLPTEQG